MTQQTAVTEALQRSEALYRTLVESSQGLVWRCDAAGRYTFLNRAWERTFGYRLEEMLGRSPRDFLPPGASTVDGPGEFVADFELTQVAQDGRTLHLAFSAVILRDDEGRVIGTQGTAQDVTDRKRVEAYRETARVVLQILNERGTWRDAVERVLATLKERTGFDAVGIRLQDGEDYPYFVQEGFPSSFLKTENTLLQREPRGGVCRGHDGKACLECTCGLVITGSDSPLLTPRGSFWTNDSAPLLDLPPEEDPRSRPRNQCIHHGYASVALVPIRSQEQIIGLIQLNDRRKDRFTLERIEVLEFVASQIGEALVRKRIEHALRESEQQLREHQERLRGMAFDAAVDQERQRRRIAVDLHDSIGQSLALARIKLSAARDEAQGALGTVIDDVVSLLSQSIIDSRSLVFALSPPVLYDLGLNAAVSWLAEEVETKHGLEVALTDDGEDKDLDETTAVVVFRAVRELLMNVLKHAGVPTATVSLGKVGESLVVLVADQGRGFDAEAMAAAPSGGSFGVFSLREQISRLGGTVEIRSTRGRGTTARVQVPLRHAERATGK